MASRAREASLPVNQLAIVRLSNFAGRWPFVPVLHVPEQLLAVHPHVRGNAVKLWTSPARSTGSQPRARGRLADAPHPPAPPPVHPTCVGTAGLTLTAAANVVVSPHVRADGGSSASFRFPNRARRPPPLTGRAGRVRPTA